MGSAWDIARDEIERGYGHLPADALYEWAIEQSELSEQWQEGKIPDTSKTAEGRARKVEMLQRVRAALEERSNFAPEEIETRIAEVEKHLEDPGLLKNFEYFDVPSSDFMLGFYFAVWDLRIAELMDYLHNYGEDLQGVIRSVPEGDVWEHMGYHECMNINERIKAKSIVNFIWDNNITRVTSFGGGNVPERLYGLPNDLQLTVFDDGPVAQLAELFPDEEQRRGVNYIHESLAKAPEHQELLGTQSLVWMHGVSMYLSFEQFVGALLCGHALLEAGGYMKFDCLLQTESMRRVIKTQNWPYDPSNPMKIFGSVDSALAYVRRALEAVNAKLAGKSYMDLMNTEATLIEPWGVQSVRFTVQKHCEHNADWLWQ